MLRTARRLFLLASVLLLAACAATPGAPGSAQRSDAQLATQLARARAALGPGQPPRIVFAGFALHSESTAFRNDVQLAGELVRRLDPHAAVIQLSNPAVGQGTDWPFATRENVQRVIEAVGQMARPQDKVVLLLASHGAPGALGVTAAGRELGHVEASELNQWLAPLRDRPTILLISACYSGSFIPQLRGPSRIILTAAAADRNSFGCSFRSNNTYFTEALLKQEAIAERSLVQLMQQARETVLKREQAQGYLPSNPQMFVGAAVQDWARLPLAQWRQAAIP
ncbi:MAG TPA: C13 family peptidase [Ramlibacter sp.]|jgi:hypothetical protein|nr:C13 family peptidase [Ramlibacter sp.]